MLNRLSLIPLITLVLIAIACSGDDDSDITPPSESPAATAATGSSPTPTATAQAQSTATAATCLLGADVCSFAREIERMVQAGDFAGIVTNARGQEYTCPAQRLPGAGGPYPLCDGAAGGERRMGHTIAYLSSEGVVVNEQGLRAALEGWARAVTPSASDAYGSGANRLFSIGCPADRDACANQTAIVFSQMRGTAPERSQLILYFDRTQRARAQLVWTVIGPLLEPQQQAAALRGGTVASFLTPPGWPPITTFHRLDP